MFCASPDSDDGDDGDDEDGDDMGDGDDSSDQQAREPMWSGATWWRARGAREACAEGARGDAARRRVSR
ncbi:hypothetical protein AMK27_04755 [Streptomyces sp. CB02009]|nr:hypothetical protein AMK27_04755 [Streptomyces sp. CB02009]